MPLHLNSITNDSQNSELLAWLFDHELQNAELAFASEDKKYIHLTRFINDNKNGERIGKFVFTLMNDEKAKSLNILDLDIVIDSTHPVPLHFLNRLEPSSDANEYYEVEAIGEGQHLEIETVNRHRISGSIVETTRDVYTSAFPFSLEIYDDIKAFNKSAGFTNQIRIGDTEYTASGYSESFAAVGGMFGAKNGETFSFLLGKVISFRDVCVQLGAHTLNFVIVQLQTALGELPTAMSREVFDLDNLSVGKVVAMKADIKVDFAK